jgi:hypothetical protein
MLDADEVTRKITRQRTFIPRMVEETQYTCDKCGRVINRDDREDGYAHELEVRLDKEQCVNFFRQRDYCPVCLEPVWAAINQLIDANPDEERDRMYDE